MRATDTFPSVTATVAMEEEPLPVLADHAISRAILDAELSAARRIQMLASCKVAPLPEIEDPQALTFENNAESVPADVEGLMTDTAPGVGRFPGPRDLGRRDIRAEIRLPAASLSGPSPRCLGQVDEGTPQQPDRRLPGAARGSGGRIQAPSTARQTATGPGFRP